MIRAALLLLAILLGACGLPPAVWTAGLGFGAAAVTFDDDLLKAVDGKDAAGAVGGGHQP